MTRVARIVCVAGFCVALMAVTGCQDQQSQDPEIGNVKKHRLIAAENMDLRRKLAKRDQQIEKLKAEHAEELQAKDELIAQAQERAQRWKEQADKGVEKEVQSVLAVVMAKNAKLQAENAALKAQLEALQGASPTMPEKSEDSPDDAEADSTQADSKQN